MFDASLAFEWYCIDKLGSQSSPEYTALQSQGLALLAGFSILKTKQLVWQSAIFVVSLDQH